MSKTQTPSPDSDKPRSHKATYGRDKRTAKYNIRVVGPHANRFEGRTVPVKTASGEEHSEKLTKLVWTGTDDGSVIAADEGKPVALYEFEQKKKEELNDEIPF